MSKSAMSALLILACLFLSGCTTVSSKGLPNFSTTEARLDAASAVANPEAKKHIEAAKEQLKAAKEACYANTEALEQAIKEKNEAVKDASVWKEKQRKALKELWIYRGAIIALVLWTFRGFLFNGALFVARKFVGVPW
jgi:predicted kinase